MCGNAAHRGTARAEPLDRGERRELHHVRKRSSLRQLDARRPRYPKMISDREVAEAADPVALEILEALGYATEHVACEQLIRENDIPWNDAHDLR